MCLELFLQSKSKWQIMVIAHHFRLDNVWNHRINTMTEKRDKYGRRCYIFRLGRFRVYKKSFCFAERPKPRSIFESLVLNFNVPIPQGGGDLNEQ